MIQSIEQFEKAATVLRAFPPKITEDLARAEGGEWCHCALGTLAVHADVAPEAINYGSIRRPLRETYGIDIDAYVPLPEGEMRREEVCAVVYTANDEVHGTPEERAEAVITAIETLICGKEQRTYYGVPV